MRQTKLVADLPPHEESARSEINESGLSNAGRALTKHPELVGATKETLRQNLRTDAALNAAA